jgi:N-acetyl-anhydromuramyl-L-alanine amidase AmpD
MSARLIAATLISTLLLPAAELAAREQGQPRDPADITAIVIHTVGGPACIGDAVRFRPIPPRDDDAKFWRDVLRSAAGADAHYVIGRSGNVAEAIKVTEVAYHTFGVNAVSIGIELVHRGDGVEPFEAAQIARLVALIKQIRRQYPAIAIGNIVRHADIDQRTCTCAGVTYRRRQDPGANFPMDRVLAEVRLPDDATGRPSSLPRFAGPAPDSACVTER